ncbi:sugar transferase [Acinetobacter indicus]|uniref:sugar transferase n=1 Tax=Acinetobacter indicus TaxID=756892 RepID=UPI002578C137|nr:sugar transferase [Acinetobacter indicus]
MFKRFLDFVASLVVLILLSPIFLAVTILLGIANKGSPFFFQQRPGKNEKIFKIIKFKTMNDAKDSDGNLLPDAERLTKVGNFIRKTSLDEIPQLINVIKGDMSLIGPRPLLVSYLDLYDEFEKQRHNVRPGITGWAQVNGRNAIDWETKFKLDVYYVENLSLWLDIKIALKTIRNVLISKDISIQPVKKLVDEKREKNAR